MFLFYRHCSMGRRSPMSLMIICFFVLQLLTWSRVLLAHESISHCSRPIMSIGAVLDLSSLMGKHHKIAMEIAVEEFNGVNCTKLDLKIKNSQGNSAQTVASAMDLAQNKQLAIMGTISNNEATMASEFNDAIKNIPILSLISPIAKSKQSSPPLPYFIQMGHDINIYIQCIAAIVGEFRWRKVTVIYELSNWFSSDPGMLLDLTYALKLVDSEIDHHVALPSLSSLSDSKSTIENELNMLKNKSNRVFLIVQSSLEMASILFEKAKQIGLMEKGCVWIIPDGVASLLDSVNSSSILNMQGVIGFRTHFMETSEAFRRFQLKFQRRFALEFPEEQSFNPSIFALRSYDATWAIAQSANESQGKFSLEEFSERLILSKFDRIGGNTNSSFMNGKLVQSPTFSIINVIGRSYREMAFWSSEHGFSKTDVRYQQMERNTSNKSSGLLRTDEVYWPGGLKSVPKGWTEERLLKIGVPAQGAFSQFVNVNYDHSSNKTSFSGFSIEVFKAAVKKLGYHLPYDFVSFDGSYDQMVKNVSQKILDGAVGDTSIIASRYHLVGFSQPYIESGLDMVVTQKPVKSKEPWMFANAFTKQMWLMMAATHIFMGFVIWLIEREVNAELKGLGAMLWFLVTIIFESYGEPIKSPLARTVLAPWLFVILIATSTFTASLTSMMTVPQLEPSILDIQTLQKRNSPVGCDAKSFIRNYLIDVLKFKSENIRRYNSMSDYPAAFQNKDIEAAFFVTPHANVFLAKYSCKGLMKAGNTLRLGGFGFVFPKGSTLATDISEALLKVIESGETRQLEKEILSIGDTASCSPLENRANDGSAIGFQPFRGLIFICSTVAIVALLYYMICLFRRNVETLTSLIKVTLTQLRRIWSWITTYLTSKLQSRSMRRVSSTTETRNEGVEITNSQQSPVAEQLVDTALAAHAS